MPVVAPFVRIFRPFICTRGFTLIELVVTLAVAAILVTTAFPAMRTFIQNTRITTQTNDLLADLSFARSEAIRRGRNSQMCTSTNGTSCNGGGVWTTGRLVWIDMDGDAALDADEILRYREVLSGSSNSLLVNGGGGPTDPIVFERSGVLATALVGSPIVGTDSFVIFSICDDRGAGFGRDIGLNRIGQPRIQRPSSCP